MLARRLALALTLGGLAACHHAPPAAPAAPAAAAAAAVVTLRELQNGDAACYVVLEKADGTQDNLPGDFELCAGGGHDATPLIGQHVTYTTQPANVLAASCEGNVDCGKSDRVDLVVTITAAP